jgi:hypothetical protein
MQHALKHCYENAGRRRRNELSSRQVITGLNAMLEAGVYFYSFFRRRAIN